jgi:hypothetical protein
MSASHPNASIDAAQVPATTELTAVRQQVRTVLEPVTERCSVRLGFGRVANLRLSVRAPVRQERTTWSFATT